MKAFRLVDRAIRLQLSSRAELSEIEDCLKAALELDPDSVEVLQESAHFYDVVVPVRAKARKYALLCREKLARVTAEIDEVLSERKTLD